MQLDRASRLRWPAVTRDESNGKFGSIPVTGALDLDRDIEHRELRLDARRVAADVGWEVGLTRHVVRFHLPRWSRGTSRSQGSTTEEHSHELHDVTSTDVLPDVHSPHPARGSRLRRVATPGARYARHRIGPACLHRALGAARASTFAMSSTPLGLLVQQCIPLLGVVALLSLSLWVGVLFSVSWLSGRARSMADGAEVGQLAAALDRRWAMPSIVASFATACLWVYVAPSARPGGTSLVALVGALLVLLAVHSSVSRRAAQVARGSIRATRGEGVRRLLLVLSLATIAALVTFGIGGR